MLTEGRRPVRTALATLLALPLLASCVVTRPLLIDAPKVADERPPALAAGKTALRVTLGPSVLRDEIERAIPKAGAIQHAFAVRGVPTQLALPWSRGPVELRYDGGRAIVKVTVTMKWPDLGAGPAAAGAAARLRQLVGSVVGGPAGQALDRGPLSVTLTAVAGTDLDEEYRLALREPKVEIAAQVVGVRDPDWQRIVNRVLEDFTHLVGDRPVDLKPLVRQLHGRIARPFRLPLPAETTDLDACLELPVDAIAMAGPGVEGRAGIALAMTLRPTVRLPCPPPPSLGDPDPLLPPLTIARESPPGAVSLRVPVAVDYTALTHAVAPRAPAQSVPGNPDLRLSNPQLYSSGDGIVVRLDIQGIAEAAMVRSLLRGNLYLVGHPRIDEAGHLAVDDLIMTPDSIAALANVYLAIDQKAQVRGVQEALAGLFDVKKLLADAGEALQKGVKLAAPGAPGCLRAKTLRASAKVSHTAGYLGLEIAAEANDLRIDLPCE